VALSLTIEHYNDIVGSSVWCLFGINTLADTAINWPLFPPWHHGNRKSPHSFFYHSVALECRYQYVLLIRDIGTFGCDVVHNSFYSPNKPAGASFPASYPSADQCDLLVVQPLNDKLFAKTTTSSAAVASAVNKQAEYLKIIFGIMCISPSPQCVCP